MFVVPRPDLMDIPYSYQCAYRTFETAGQSREVARDAMHAAVKIAAQARDDFDPNRKIALSLGPFAATLSPTQEYSGIYPPPFGPSDSHTTFANTVDGEGLEAAAIRELTYFHLERLQLVAENQDVWNAIDCLAFETIPLAREVIAIRNAVKLLEDLEHGRKKPWWITFVLPEGRPLESKRDGQLLTVGEMANVALRSEDGCAQPTAIGVNCTGAGYIQNIIGELTVATKQDPSRRPWLVVYPNSGEIYEGEGKWSGAPESWQEVVKNVANGLNRKVWAGALIGGCCRTKPKDIKELASSL